MQSEIATKRRILVIDNEMDILSLLDDVFSYSGFEVDAQSDPVLALKHFHDNPKSYDLVLLDIWLGSFADGLTLYNKLKQADPEVKIFVFTALQLDLAQFTKKCPSFNESYLIRKPIRMNLLVDKINSVLT